MDREMMNEGESAAAEEEGRSMHGHGDSWMRTLNREKDDMVSESRNQNDDDVGTVCCFLWRIGS
jgi:hypothetical protein